MRFVFVLALLSCGAAAVFAGDASTAAIQLGAGVSLLSASSSNPLSLTASTSDLCPVIAYAASVDELPASELSQLKLASGSAGLYAQHAQQNAAAQAKPYKVTITPIKYAQNNTRPSVDWIDLHFKSVSSVLAAASTANPAQSVKMLRSDSMSMSSDSSAHLSMSSMHPMASMSESMPMAAPGASFSFGPIFLAPNDELFFGMTICASMIDCDTATHKFSPAMAEEQTQAKLRKQQQEQEQQQQQQQQEQESARRRSSPRAQSEQQPVQRQQQQEQQGACPAIAYTHKLDCGDVSCKVSFVNLSPSKPLDWVDLHVVKADPQSLSHFLSIAGTQPLGLALRDSQINQFNYAMTLAAGAQPQMMMHGESSSMMHGASESPSMMMPMRSSVGSQSVDHLSNALSLQKFGAASLADSVLAEAGGSQVWQFELPLEFKGGDLAGVSFTYCASGTDCDTELAFYKLKETGEANKQQQLESSVNQQQKLGLGEHAQQQQQQSNIAVGESVNIGQIGQQQKKQSVMSPRGFRGSLNQDRDL